MAIIRVVHRTGGAVTDGAAGRVETCDLCIVGAGLAGLNALFAASRYLTPHQRIILVDSRSRVGGMWVDTYDYVRLHQPHPMFTAGNIAWTLDREPAYLATKDEVLDHFSHCLQVLGQRVRVDEFFGWTMESHASVHGRQQVVCRAADGGTVTIDTPKLIKAIALDVSPNDPLTLSSTAVHSVSPDYCDVRSGAIADDDKPVWIVGGGKTGMDTAHALITACPGREVNLIAAGGTAFFSRDKVLPTGARRWWAGTPTTGIGYQTAHRFDGTNEAEVAPWFQRRYCTQLTSTADNFLLGVLSEAEKQTIAEGLHSVVMDRLVDVVDRDGTAELVLAGGAHRTVERGSWLVNCTGYLLRKEHPYEPYCSSDGSVLSIQTRSGTLHLTSYMAYYLTHLMFLRKLGEVPLYEADFEEFRRKARSVLPYTMFSLINYNLGLIADAVPAKVFTECGLDFDRWYPLPRRIFETARFMATHRRDRERHRQTLDTVRERFDVRCGPLRRDSVLGV